MVPALLVEPPVYSAPRIAALQGLGPTRRPRLNHLLWIGRFGRAFSELSLLQSGANCPNDRKSTRNCDLRERCVREWQQPQDRRKAS